MSHEDEITLGGQTFPIRGSAVVKPASEFTTGMKVGKATYDERLHAFWLVLDDFSGGMNHRRLDIREALGTVFDNGGGIDVRRPGHVTLPPFQVTADITAPTAYKYTGRQPSIPMIGSDVGSLLTHAGFGSGLYTSDDAGDSLTLRHNVTDAYMIARILEFGGSGTATLYAFPEGTGGAAEYVKSTNGTSWAAAGTGATKTWEDAIIWHAFKQDIIVATTPIAKIGYSLDGATWNVDDTDADVAKPIWQANYGRIQFVGTYMAPWGEPAIYFLARDDAGIQSLFALSFYAGQAYKIDIGNKMHLHDGLVWNGAVIVTDGWSVKMYNPGSSEIVRDISFPRKGGMCPVLAGAGIVKLIGGTDYLYAILYRSGGGTQVLCYNGAGWTTLGTNVLQFASVVGGINADWKPSTISTARRICLLGGRHATDVWTDAGTPKTMTLQLPARGEVPVAGTDGFAEGGATQHFITGWIDGGFREINGALFWMKIDAFNINANEYVKVEYQLNNAESSTWVQMRDSSNVADVFESIDDTLYFSATTPKKGIEFKTVRFRFTPYRTAGDANKTLTPEIVAFILLYDKKPDLREAWAFRIDVNRMLEMKTTYQVDSVDATVALIWAKLRTLWDTKPLLVFDVPNIRTDMLVRISDMPGTFDDFRDAVDGKGYIDVQVLEPVSA